MRVRLRKLRARKVELRLPIRQLSHELRFLSIYFVSSHQIREIEISEGHVPMNFAYKLPIKAGAMLAGYLSRAPTASSCSGNARSGSRVLPTFKSSV